MGADGGIAFALQALQALYSIGFPAFLNYPDYPDYLNYLDIWIIEFLGFPRIAAGIAAEHHANPHTTRAVVHDA
ncbi:hypothetical protein [Bifidobacterium jacchi]|uniref:Uncharacterized protein n=1 Tax=Bifidobacterium jacchi TaxID=2490545 RepID=A0A5N5RGP4_9BIFI|nr:hypothetical protein [Bifidobacterium jacchi]KAB5606415.1 hypothetical protein EHS19_07300 [Bifidobacterium jacchi]